MLGDVGPAVGFILVGAALIYFLVVWLIADYASKKGHSLVAFLLLGLFISPIISLIAALLVEDKRIPRSPVPVAVDRFDREDHLDRLKKLTELRDAGTLTEEEFEAEKAHILAERS